MKTAAIQSGSRPPEAEDSPRFMASVSERIVHDLSREQPECQLCEIEIDHRVYFATLAVAHGDGFRDCKHCI